jgi:hypothetical protein
VKLTVIFQLEVPSVDVSEDIKSFTTPIADEIGRHEIGVGEDHVFSQTRIRFSVRPWLVQANYLIPAVIPKKLKVLSKGKYVTCRKRKTINTIFCYSPSFDKYC